MQRVTSSLFGPLLFPFFQSTNSHGFYLPKAILSRAVPSELSTRCFPLWFFPALTSSTSTLLPLLLIYLQPRCRLYPHGPEPSVIRPQSCAVLDYQHYAQCDVGYVIPIYFLVIQLRAHDLRSCRTFLIFNTEYKYNTGCPA